MERVSVDRADHNVFDLGHTLLTTFGAGTLVPVLCMEVVPADFHRVRSEVFLRTMPQINPTMHECDLAIHYFYCPNYLVHENFPEWWSGGERGDRKTTNPDGSPGVDMALPMFTRNQVDPDSTSNLFALGSLADYFGIPVGSSAPDRVSPLLRLSCLPFRHYQRIYSEHYRDQNLMPPRPWYKSDQLEVLEKDFVEGIFSLRNRCWERDLFTSALPWTQRGEESAFGFLSGHYPVTLVEDYNFRVAKWQQGSATLEQTSTSTASRPLHAHQAANLTNPSGDLVGEPVGSVGYASISGIFNASSATPVVPLIYNPNGTLEIDFTEVDNGDALVSVNEMRYSIALQHLRETRARAGGKPHEAILSSYGAHSSYTKYYKPVCFGGGTMSVTVMDVAQTSSSDETSPQGTLAGKSVSYSANDMKGSIHIPDHGYIIALLSIRPKSVYMDGVPKHFLKDDPYDYLEPTLQGIGEQPVLNAEVYARANATDPLGTWGYHRPYYEYAYHPSRVTGQFREGSLLSWHMARKFTSQPTLSAQFVEMQPGSDELTRIFPYAGTETVDTHKYIAQIYHHITSNRPLDLLGEPGLDRI